MAKATKLQRFLAMFIDLALISILVSLCVKGFAKLVHFDISNMDYYLEAYVGEVEKYVTAAFEDTNYDTTLMMKYLGEYFKYNFVNLGFRALFSVIFVSLYLVVLPMFWNKQTLGRFVMKVQVMRKDESKATLNNILLRELVGTCLLYLLVGGFSIFLATLILVLCNNRSLVDYIGGTSLFSTIDNGLAPEASEPTPSRDDYIDAKFKDVPTEENKEENTDDEYRVF